MAWNKSYVYFGSADFSRRILLGLIESGCRPCLVVSTIAKPAGRGLKNTLTPVANYAQENKLPLVLVSSFKKGICQELQETGADFAVLAAFGKIIPEQLLNLYPSGIINVHPSLLPLYRGPSPIQCALMAGVTETGISIIKLDPEVDHGPIICQQAVNINHNDTASDLETSLAKLAIDQLLDCVPKYLEKKLIPVEQNHSQATFTYLIKKADGWADFTKTAENINNKRRALTPWPGLWTTWEGQRLKLIKTDTLIVEKPIENGCVIQTVGKILIGCAENTALVLETVQLTGGKTQNVQEFINGHKKFPGSILGKN